ncbi:hypothetical protein N9N67_11645 [Bacteriovoracaceae bacterium]|nr:hypothetical protein [Bacteriovoracaceae bacterium]
MKSLMFMFCLLLVLLTPIAHACVTESGKIVVNGNLIFGDKIFFEQNSLHYDTSKVSIEYGIDENNQPFEASKTIDKSSVMVKAVIIYNILGKSVGSIQNIPVLDNPNIAICEITKSILNNTPKGIYLLKLLDVEGETIETRRVTLAEPVENKSNQTANN